MKKNQEQQTTIHEALSQYFTEAELLALKSLANERIIRGELPDKVDVARGATVIKTVRIDKQLFQDAALIEPNFSKLIELLLYKFLSSNPKYLRKDKQ